MIFWSAPPSTKNIRTRNTGGALDLRDSRSNFAFPQRGLYIPRLVSSQDVKTGHPGLIPRYPELSPTP